MNGLLEELLHDLGTPPLRLEVHLGGPAGRSIGAWGLFAEVRKCSLDGANGYPPVLDFGIGGGLVFERTTAARRNVDGAATAVESVCTLASATKVSYSSWVIASCEGVETDSFFACPEGAFVAVPGAALAVVAGREAVVLAEGARDERVVPRVVGCEASAAGREVRGRFAAVEEEGASDDLEDTFPGGDRIAEPAIAGVLRAAGFLFSSPDVTDDSSGSASDAVDLEANPPLLAADPGAGRVGGLFKLDPTVPVRDMELDEGFDALIEGRAVLAAAAGRRAPTVAVPPVVVGRRGGTASLPAEPNCEAILRRTDDVGVEGGGSFLRCGLPSEVLGGASASLPPSIVYDRI